MTLQISATQLTWFHAPNELLLLHTSFKLQFKDFKLMLVHKLTEFDPKRFSSVGLTFLLVAEFLESVSSALFLFTFLSVVVACCPSSELDCFLCPSSFVVSRLTLSSWVVLAVVSIVTCRNVVSIWQKMDDILQSGPCIGSHGWEFEQWKSARMHIYRSKVFIDLSVASPVWPTRIVRWPHRWGYIDLIDWGGCYKISVK